MDLGLRGKIALVTGSTRGIGLATALTLLEEGCVVVVNGRQQVLVDSTVAMLSDAAEGATGRAFGVAADVSEASGCEKVARYVAEELGSLDILVANVGSGGGTPGLAVAREEWMGMMRTNLLSAVGILDLALPLLQVSSGAVVFVGSIVSEEAIPAPIGYSAAKAALMAAMKNYARQCAQWGIRVNAVVPGNVLFEGGTWAAKIARDPDAVNRYIKSEVPLARFATPEEIASSIVFLCSRRAGFITGSKLRLDGGQTRSW